MPTKIVDLSARSEIICAEPFIAHFWECTPEEFKAYLAKPRGFLTKMGIGLPGDCRIETTIEDHDQLGVQLADSDGKSETVICNLGRGSVGHEVYHVTSYARDRAGAGAFKKRLLHKSGRQQVDEKERRRKQKSK